MQAKMADDKSLYHSCAKACACACLHVLVCMLGCVHERVQYLSSQGGTAHTLVAPLSSLSCGARQTATRPIS